jgi:hypothetical protein
MVLPLIARGVGALAAKQASKEVAKRAPGRAEKFMGMADEVKPLRLTDDVMRAGERAAGPAAERGMSAASKAGLATAAALGAGMGVGALRSGKEEKTTKASEAARSAEEDNKAPSTKTAAAKKSATRISFEREFARNRAAGEREFTFNGETYTTRYDGETAAQHRKKMEDIVDKENRLRARDDETMRKAREEKQTLKADEMRKGGMVKKQAYAKGGMVAANCGASMKPQQRKK